VFGISLRGKNIPKKGEVCCGFIALKLRTRYQKQNISVEIQSIGEVEQIATKWV